MAEFELDAQSRLEAVEVGALVVEGGGVIGPAEEELLGVAVRDDDGTLELGNSFDTSISLSN